jgi:large subunit ribosomal protein L6
MSRIGKQPIVIPEKVDVKINGNEVLAKGPLGELKRDFLRCIKFEIKDNLIHVKTTDDTRESRCAWGMSRTLVSNLVHGVSTGFKRSLIYEGVGYKAAVKGSDLVLNLGYSHPINFKIPTGITIKVVKNTIDITGTDKELIGFVAAKIRSFREPEPYKGKGVRYSDEVIIRKAGKSGKK